MKCAHIGAAELQPLPGCGVYGFVTGRLRMLGLIARWGHNVLITTMGLLTIAMVVSLIQ
jgi:hypothetical protein